MRRSAAYLSVFAMLAASCADLGPDVPSSDENVVSLVLSPGKMGVTRAAEYGEDKFNENVISNFRLYFYTDGSSDDDNAVYVYPSEDGFARASGNEAATVSGDVVGSDPSTGKVTVSIKLTEDEIKKIFPSSATSCGVYAVANIEGVSSDPSSTSVNSLKKITVTANFGPDGSVTESPYAKAQDSFVMDGEAALTFNPSSRTVSGEVPMRRAASKITLTVTKITKEGVDDKNWEPQTGQMSVSYINGVGKGYLNGEMSKADREESLFSYKTASDNKSRSLSGDATSGWTHDLPFYSYYNLWRDPENASNPDCSDAPYLMLSLPWRHAENGRYFTCYYAVPFNTVTGHLDRNTWYRIKVSLNILGSGDPDNPTVINPSYMILPWGDEHVKTDADLFRYRYLMVDDNEYVMNNVNSLSVPYYSSHPVTVVSSSMTRTVLKPSSGYKPYEQTVSASSYTLTPNSDNTALVFTHNLVNDYSSDYDVTAYKLTFTIQHSDDASFSETITVTQYPALYVVAELNSDCNTSHIDSGTSGDGWWIWSSWSNHSNYGYVYVNGVRGSSGWTTVSYSGGNKDPYRYVVTVSSLPSGTPFTIGDPRSDIIATLSFTGSGATGPKSAPDIDGSGNRYLSYYYPTDATASQINMIAPVFRIASSYGVTSAISFSDATKRCATYQEDGYPAGRWRIPTQAEIWYMVKLASDEKIPELLTTTSYYWGGDGYAYIPSTDYSNPTRTQNNSYVRCVYDEWYWTDKCEKTTFTWGDRQR